MFQFMKTAYVMLYCIVSNKIHNCVVRLLKIIIMQYVNTDKNKS